MTYILLSLVALLACAGILLRQRERHVIYPWEVGLLYVDGIFMRILEAGSHRPLYPFKEIRVTRVSSNANFMNTALTDVASKDGLPYRMSAQLIYNIVDARRFAEDQPIEHMTAALTVALAEIAVASDLIEIQASRIALNERLLAAIGQPRPEIEILSAQISQIILPPETRRLYVEVEKARLEGLAALERARGEQAALRSLSNAARLLKDNPELMNLRLLQAVQNAKGSSTIVLGQGALAAGVPPQP